MMLLHAVLLPFDLFDAVIGVLLLLWLYLRTLVIDSGTYTMESLWQVGHINQRCYVNKLTRRCQTACLLGSRDHWLVRRR